MNVGIVGFGAMGRAMGGHISAKGDVPVCAYDIDPACLADVDKLGVTAATSIDELAAQAEVIIIMVATDEQALQVSDQLLGSCAEGSVLAFASTLHPNVMIEIGEKAVAQGVAVVDSPVVFGLSGAKEGTLVSLCGGEEADIERIRPALECYSRKIYHVGPLGTGQLAKTINNMLHWSSCVANFEALLLGKRYGLDAQKLREILLDCPAQNGTLREWDSTRLTWPEKDMDIALDLAQEGDLMLPLFGQVDQLVKLLKPPQIKGLLHGESTTYLGREITAISNDN